jgi:hypothetical protein
METLDEATVLRNMAQAARAKKDEKQVKSSEVLSRIVKFLNNDNLQFEAVEDLYPASRSNTSILASFRKQVIENKLDDLVFPVITDDHVMLVKLVETTPAQDEDN